MLIPQTMTPSPTPVALVRCAEYDPAVLASALDRAMSLLGGWGRFVQPGQRVLLKANLLSDHPPEHAVTTHPEVIRAVIRAVKAHGATPLVGDSPASAVSLARIWEKTGVQDLCRAEGVELVAFEGEGARRVERDGFVFTLSPALARVDAVINLPKVKTHALTTLTCGVKNLYGCIPGYQKAALHKQYPRPADFGRMLQAIADEVRPVLTLADGIVGMEGEGPASGTPAPLGFLAAAADPYALDRVVCRVLGILPRSVPYLAGRLGGGSDPVVGEAPEALRPVRFRIPSTVKARLVPAWLTRWVAPLIWVRPSFDATLCIRCGRCVNSCPVRVLAMENPVPVLVRSRQCIGCCCCHEMCPVKAVHMRQSPLLRTYGAFKDL